MRLPSDIEKAERVMRSYKGIEGEPWPLNTSLLKNCLKGGLAPLSHYEAVIKYYKKACEKYFCDLICLQPLTKMQISNKILSHKFSFCGYDYGIYASEYNYYSIIFHEVIFGKYDELRSLTKFLNKNYLLPSPNEAGILESVRKQLLASGADLETVVSNEVLGLISIYCHKRI